MSQSPTGWQYRVTPDFLLSSSSGLSPVEGFCKNREKEGTSGEEKDSGGRNDLRDVSQMSLYLIPLFPRPSVIRVADFHKQLHQPLDRENFHQDGLFIDKDQPFKIRFDHRPTTDNSVFLACTFSTQFERHGRLDSTLAPHLTSSENLISNPLFSQI